MDRVSFARRAKGILQFVRCYLPSRHTFLLGLTKAYRTTPSRLGRLTRGETVFILAPGSSVNDLTTSQWKVIQESFSIGINSWMLHKFVPDLYFLEMANGPAESASNLAYYHHLVCQKAFASHLGQRGLAVVKVRPQSKSVIRYLAKRGGVFIDSIVLHGFTEEDVISQLRKLSNLPCLPARLVSFSTSVDSAVTFAILMGFRQVVLVGVDQTSGYFFANQSSLRPEATCLGPIKTVPHTTSDPTVRSPLHLLPNMLNLLKKEFPSVSIQVGTPSDLLEDSLATYEWEDQRDREI